MKHIGNGEGHTVLVLTDTESRLIRYCLEQYEKERGSSSGATPTRAWANGIQRATERMRAEEKAGRNKP